MSKPEAAAGSAHTPMMQRNLYRVNIWPVFTNVSQCVSDASSLGE